MIVVGDIACPTKEMSVKLGELFSKHEAFQNKRIICNLEGLITDEQKLSDNSPVLFNHSSVLAILKKAGVAAVSLANNHTLDLPAQYAHTARLLEANHVLYNGAGMSHSEAAKSISFSDNGEEVIMISACWDFLLYHQNNPSEGVHIHTIEEEETLQRIARLRHEKPAANILVFLHWSFDLEILPFPMYRQWAKKLIDTGCNAVIGCHSHCVQGGEKYKEGYIVYGLGNFFLPSHTFANGSLTFPDFSKTELVFEYNTQTKKAFCHWFDYQKEDHSLKHLSSDDFETSEMLKAYSPFQGMSEEAYLDYFRKHRRKKLLVPIYRDYQQRDTNQRYTRLLKMRARFARTLAKYKIRKWQS